MGVMNYLDDANLAYKFLVSGLSLVYVSGLQTGSAERVYRM